MFPLHIYPMATPVTLVVDAATPTATTALLHGCTQHLPDHVLCTLASDRRATLASLSTRPPSTRLIIQAPPGLDPLVAATVLEMGVGAIQGPAAVGGNEYPRGDRGDAPDDPSLVDEFLADIDILSTRARLELVVAVVHADQWAALTAPTPQNCGRLVEQALTGTIGLDLQLVCDNVETASVVLTPLGRGRNMEDIERILASIRRFAPIGTDLVPLGGWVDNHAGEGEVKPRSPEAFEDLVRVATCLTRTDGHFYRAVKDATSWDVPPWARIAASHMSSALGSMAATATSSSSSSHVRTWSSPDGQSHVYSLHTARSFDPQRVYDLIAPTMILYEGDRNSDLQCTKPVSSLLEMSDQDLLGARILRVQGGIYLAGRDEMEGSLRIMGRHAILEPLAPWEEDSGTSDDREGSGTTPARPRAQSLWWTGEQTACMALAEGLQQCLCSVDQPERRTGTDPFAPWPTSAQWLGLDEDEEGDEEDDEGEDTDRLATQFEELVVGQECNLGGHVVPITDGGAQLQSLLTALDGEVVLVEWLADWVEVSAAMSTQMTTLAAERPDVAVARIDMLATPSNEALAFGQVLTHPTAIRKDKPVLKKGAKFPCVTVHWAPSFHPVATLTGDSAIDDVREWLTTSCPSAGTSPARVLHVGEEYTQTYPWPPPGARGTDMTNPLIVPPEVGRLTDGAVGLQRELQVAKATSPYLVLLWFDDQNLAQERNALASLSLVISRFREARFLLSAYGDAKSPNGRLAIGMQLGVGEEQGAARSPALVLIMDKQIKAKITSVQLTPRTLAENLLRAGLPLPSSSAHPSDWDPPVGSAAFSGYRRTIKGRNAYLWPRMPCLRCGCPWWTSEEWDARCIRCKWSCENDGYDDDSNPLEEWKETWTKFVENIRVGKCPAYVSHKIRAVKDKDYREETDTVGDHEGRNKSTAKSSAAGTKKKKASGKTKKGNWDKFY